MNRKSSRVVLIDKDEIDGDFHNKYTELLKHKMSFQLGFFLSIFIFFLYRKCFVFCQCITLLGTLWAM